MWRLFRARRRLARVVLGVVVALLGVGLVGSTVAWYLEPRPQEERPPSETEAPAGEVSLPQLLGKYEQMAARDPDNVSVLTGYARVALEAGRYYAAEGNKERARELFGRAVALYQKLLAREDNPSLRLELAWAYKELGERERAKEEVSRVLAKEPNNPEARFLEATLR